MFVIGGWYAASRFGSVKTQHRSVSNSGEIGTPFTPMQITRKNIKAKRSASIRR